MATVVEHDRRKYEILQKAMDVFVKEGYEDVTFQKIADRCGITRTTLYIYFKIHFKENKEYFKISLTENKNYEFKVNKIIYLNKEKKRECFDFTVFSTKSVVGVILHD